MDKPERSDTERKRSAKVVRRSAASGDASSARDEPRRATTSRRRKRRDALNRDLLKLCERYGATELGPRIVALAELLEAAHSRIALRDGGNGTCRSPVPRKAGS